MPGYNLEVLPNDNKEAVDVGLKYVNNDACTLPLMVVGQIMQALLSGKYDFHKVAIIMSRTGAAAVLPAISAHPPGSCKSDMSYSGYIHQLKRLEIQPRALDYTKAGHTSGLRRCIRRYSYEMCVPYAPLRGGKGSANALHRKWEKNV